MRSGLWIVIVATVAMAMSSCGGDSSTVTTESTTSTVNTSPLSKVCPPSRPTGLRETAIAWANATLTGTVCDQLNLQGPACLTFSPGTPDVSAKARAEADAELRKQRAHLQQGLGVRLSAIKITGVRFRNVTATSGEAEVQYNFPASVVGNYNWVTYELHDGQWKVADCNGPIGYNGSESTVTFPTVTP